MTKPLKILVIPDTHLKPQIFDKADKILAAGKADYAICLGDYVDDWDCVGKPGVYQEHLERMVKFMYDHPETEWLVGNHDFAYMHLDPGINCSGHSYECEGIVRQYFAKMQHKVKFKLVVRRGKVIFSHAGLTQKFVEHQYARTLENFADPKKKFGFHLTGNVEDYIINDLNLVVHSEHNYMDLWGNDSPLWARETKLPMFKGDEYLQVIGHTPTKKIEEKNGCVWTDAFSTYSYYPYPPYGEEKFVIVNCSNGTWETVDG